MMVDEMMWVVERGSPIRDATSMTVAADASAVNPGIGLRWTRLMPRVLMIRQPPNAVPSPIALAQRNITRKGT